MRCCLTLSRVTLYPKMTGDPCSPARHHLTCRSTAKGVVKQNSARKLLRGHRGSQNVFQSASLGLAQALLRCSAFTQASSPSAQVSSPSAQIKAAVTRLRKLKRNQRNGNKSSVYGYSESFASWCSIRDKIFPVRRCHCPSQLN